MKLFTIIMSLFFLTHCIQFEESAFDPNSPLSTLTRLAQLAGAGGSTPQQPILGIDMELELKKADGSDYGGNFLEFSQAQESGALRSSPQPRNQSIRVAIQAGGKAKVRISSNGIIRFRIIDASNAPLAEFTLTIPANFDFSQWQSLVPEVVSGDLAVVILSFTPIVADGSPASEAITNFRIIGSVNNRIFALTENNIPNDTTGEFRLRLNTSTDGLNFNAINIQDNLLNFPVDTNSVRPYFYNASNPIQTGADSYFFILEAKENIAPDFRVVAYIGIHTDGSSITDLYRITPRSTTPGAKLSLDLTSIHFVSGQLVYGEVVEESGNRAEFRKDSNFLRQGSTNARIESELPELNVEGQLKPDSGRVFSHKGGIVFGGDFAIQEELFASNDLTNQFSQLPLVQPPPEATVNFYTATPNFLFNIQTFANGERYNVVFGKMVDFDPFVTHPSPQLVIDGSPSSFDLGFQPWFSTLFLEFGSSYLVAPGFENGNPVVIAGTGGSFELVDIKTQLNMGTDTFFDTDNFGTANNKIHFYYLSPGLNEIQVSMSESTNGTTWVAPVGIIIQNPQ